MNSIFLTALAATELVFTAAKAATLMLNLDRRIWKACAIVCFIVESVLGITVTTWLAIIVFSPPEIGLSIGVIVIVFTEVFSVACEFTIIRRKVLKIEAPPPTVWAKRTRQVIKYIAFVGCALVSIVFVCIDNRHFSSLTTTIITLVLFCSLTVVGLSMFAAKRTTLRALFAIFIILFFSTFAVVRPYFRTLSHDAAHSFRGPPQFDFNNGETAAIFLAAVGTFLVVLAAWRIPDLSIESDPEAANVIVLEIAFFAVTVPLLTLSAVVSDIGIEAVKLIILTVLPQSMVIIGPICFVYLIDLVR